MYRFSRCAMYRRIGAFFEVPRSGNVLCISGRGPLADFFAAGTAFTDARYPAVDTQCLPYPDDSFDYVISDQVLEHVENPFQAVSEQRRVVRAGGWVILTTCMINPVHRFPEDYWRFTPAALRTLCKDFSEVAQCDGWGNLPALSLILFSKHVRLKMVEPGSFLDGLTRWSDGKNLLVTWIIARK